MLVVKQAVEATWNVEGDDIVDRANVVNDILLATFSTEWTKVAFPEY